MAFSSSPKDTRSEGWAVQIPWWRDSSGRPNTWCGDRPSWHGMIFFLGAGASTRIALNTLMPANPFWYIAAYTLCIVAGLAVGRAVRARADETFSRMCSGWLSFVGFTGTSIAAGFATAATPAEAPPMAHYAPAAASAFLMLLTLGGSLLARLFPACTPEQVVRAEIEDLTRRLADARDRQATLERTPRARRSPSARPARPATGFDARTVRAWARSAGYEVPARGRVPAHIVAAWRAAGQDTTS
ncbi:histone-like nucleoid-structuring protein Lsr2 [Streptomyces sp. NPDC050625]|uniref:Lsr2 family DNA-binding protein n=1 Tax=Streptomyces sp. NPDC050625 TaxID=3154629 RepID=UPI003442B7F0